MYGRPGVERIDLNLDTFWSGGPLTTGTGTNTGTGTDTSPASVLASLRQAVRERDDLRIRHATPCVPDRLGQ